MPLVRDPFNTSYLSLRIADTYPKEKIKINMVKERATSVCFYLMVKERASRFFRLYHWSSIFYRFVQKIFQLFPVVGIREREHGFDPCPLFAYLSYLPSLIQQDLRFFRFLLREPLNQDKTWTIFSFNMECSLVW